MHLLTIMYYCLQNGCSPLYMACGNGHTEIVDILLKNRADPNLVTTVYEDYFIHFTIHSNLHCVHALLLIEHI